MAAPPASLDSVNAVGNLVSNTRADLLVGQGNILKNAGDNVSAILRDANNNAQFANANIERSSVAGLQETVRQGERIGSQATTIAWNEMGLQNAGFAAQSAQIDRINEAQSAFSDRAAKFNSQMLSDSFARLSAQGENGFARELDATTQGTRQVVQSEMGVTRSLYEGFRDGSASAAANYANLSAQNALINNRTGDHTANVLGVMTRQHGDMSRDLISISRELMNQAAANASVAQLEAAKNSAASQLQAAVNSKEGVLQASFLAKDALLENSKWFALAEKTAMVNKLDTDAKLAACCCEIKEAVIGTANTTQALLQSTEASRVRDALSAAVAENSILRLRREERPPFPVPYPFPFRDRDRSRSPPRR
jgi:hypothetical protein